MLDTAALSQLSEYLTLIREPIELAASLDDSTHSRRLRELLEEIASLSDMVTLVEEADARTPSFVIRRIGSDVGVRFAGLPMGHEFASLVLALVQVGGHPPKLDEDVIEAIRALDGGEFVTYMSLTCQNCPTVVQALNTMSVINPKIRHTAVEGGAFEAEVAGLGITAVPAVYKDSEVFAHGRMEIGDILDKLDPSSAEARSKALDSLEPFDLLVVGAGPAGATAAIYAARKALRTGIIAERFGGQILDTASIENFSSIRRTEGPALASSLEEHVRSYDVEIMTGHRVSALTAPSESDPLFSLTAGGARLRSRSVILATGASYRLMGVPGEQEYRNKGVTFCPHCDGPLFAGREVAVIGGGNSGIEAAIDLAAIASRVTVVEFLDELKADAVLVKTLNSLPNVTVRTGVRVLSVLGDGKAVTALEVENRSEGTREEIPVAGVFVQIGLVPNTGWLEAPALTNSRGEILVDPRGATAVPGLFAAGDCATTPYKQILTALGSGATAALTAFDHLMREGAAAPATIDA